MQRRVFRQSHGSCCVREQETTSPRPPDPRPQGSKPEVSFCVARPSIWAVNVSDLEHGSVCPQLKVRRSYKVRTC